MFANATPERPALYFTVLGESAIKMLRYQQQYTFFDPAKLPGSIRFINLSQVVWRRTWARFWRRLPRKLKKSNPAVVVVDSFRTMVRKPQSDMDLQSFIQRLALFLASWQATTFLIGEYAEDELRDNPIFTVADGLFWAAPNGGAKLNRAEVAGHKTAPARLPCRLAHLSHHQYGTASFLAHLRP